MGQKVNPIGFRIGITEDWRSKWFSPRKEFGNWVVEDHKIKEHVKKKYANAGISKVTIDRIGPKLKLHITAARPGLIIGKRGANVDMLTQEVSGMTKSSNVDLDIKEVENPEMDAQIVAQSIKEQLEKRAPFKRTIRKYSEMIMDLGAQGTKIQVKGRLGGAEIARGEYVSLGKLPLHTLRAKIDYGTATAIITKGTIGIKVWICKGEVLPLRGVKKHASNAQAGQV